MDLAKLSVSFSSTGTQNVVQDAQQYVKSVGEAEKATKTLANTTKRISGAMDALENGSKGKGFISTLQKMTQDIQALERQTNRLNALRGFQSFYDQLGRFNSEVTSRFGATTNHFTGNVQKLQGQVRALEGSFKNLGNTGNMPGIIKQITDLDKALDAVGKNKRGGEHKSDYLKAVTEGIRAQLNTLAAEVYTKSQEIANAFSGTKNLTSKGIGTIAPGKGSVSSDAVYNSFWGPMERALNAVTVKAQELVTRSDMVNQRIMKELTTGPNFIAPHGQGTISSEAIYQSMYGNLDKAIEQASGKAQALITRQELQAKQLQERLKQIQTQNLGTTTSQTIAPGHGYVGASSVYDSMFGGAEASLQKAFAAADANMSKVAASAKQASSGMREALVKPLDDWATIGRRSASAIKKEMAEVEAAYGRLSRRDLSGGDANAALNGQIAALRKLRQELKAAEADPSSMGTKFNNIVKSITGIKSISQIFTNTALYSGAYTLLNILMQMPGAIIGVSLKMEVLRKSFEGVFGSAEAGAKHLTYVMDTANKFGKDIESVAGGYRKFSAATDYVGMSAKESQRIFEAVTAAIVKMGGSSDDVGGTLTALTQMISKGTVSAEEFRLQFAERIPGAMKMGADAMGVTVAQFKELMKAGDLDSIDFLRKFVPELEKFGVGWEKAADTATANLERMKNSFMKFADDQTLADLVSVGAKIATAILDGISGTLSKSERTKDLKKALLTGVTNFSDISGQSILGLTAGVLSGNPLTSMLGEALLTSNKDIENSQKQLSTIEHSVERALELKKTIEELQGAKQRGNNMDGSGLEKYQEQFRSSEAGKKIIEDLIDKIKTAQMMAAQGINTETNNTKVNELSNLITQLTGKQYVVQIYTAVDMSQVNLLIATIGKLAKNSAEVKMQEADAQLKLLNNPNYIKELEVQRDNAREMAKEEARRGGKADPKAMEDLKRLEKIVKDIPAAKREAISEVEKAQAALAKDMADHSAESKAYKAKYGDASIDLSKLPRYGDISQADAAVLKFGEKLAALDARAQKGMVNEQAYWTGVQVMYAEREGALKNIAEAQDRANKKGEAGAKTAALQENAYEKLTEKIRDNAMVLQESLSGNDIASQMAKIEKTFNQQEREIESHSIKGQDTEIAKYWNTYEKGIKSIAVYKNVFEGMFPSAKEAEDLQAMTDNLDAAAKALGWSAEQTELFKNKILQLTSENTLKRLQELQEVATTLPEKLAASNAKMDELTKAGGKGEQDVWDSILKDFEDNSKQMLSSRLDAYDKMIAEAERAGNAELKAFAQLGKEDTLRQGLEDTVKRGSPDAAAGARWSLEFDTYKSYETRKREEAVATADIMIGLTQDVSSNVTSGIGDLIRGFGAGTANLEDLWKSFLASMLDSFASAVQQIIANWVKSGLTSLMSPSTSSGGASSGGGSFDIAGLLGRGSSNTSLYNGGYSTHDGRSTLTAGYGGNAFSNGGKSAGSGWNVNGANVMAVAAGAGTAIGGLTSGNAMQSIGGGLMTAGGIISMIPGGQLIGGITMAVGGLVTLFSSMAEEEKKKPPSEVWSGKSLMFSNGSFSGFGVTQMSDGSTQTSGLDPMEMEEERLRFKKTVKDINQSMKVLDIGFNQNWDRNFSFQAMGVPDKLAPMVSYNMKDNAAAQAMGEMSYMVKLFKQGMESLDQTLIRLAKAFGTVSPLVEPLGIDLAKMAGATDAVILSYAAIATGFNAGVGVITEAMQNQADTTDELTDSLRAVGESGAEVVRYFEQYRKQLTNIVLAQYSEQLIDAAGGEDAFQQAMTVFSNYAMGNEARANANVNYYKSQFTSGLTDLGSLLPNFDTDWIGDNTDAFWAAYAAAMNESMPASIFDDWVAIAQNVANLEEAEQALADIEFSNYAWDAELKYRRQIADEQTAGAEMTRWAITMEQELADARKNNATYAQQAALVETQIYEMEAKLRELRGQESDEDDLTSLTKKLKDSVAHQIAALQDLAAEASASATAFEAFGKSLRDAIESITEDTTTPLEKFTKARAEFNTDFSTAMKDFSADAQEAMGNLPELAEKMLESAKKTMSYSDYNVLEARTLSRLGNAATRSELQGEYGGVASDLYTNESDLLTRVQEELQSDSPDSKFVADANALFEKLAKMSDAAKDTAEGDMTEASFKALAKSTYNDLMSSSDLKQLLAGTLNTDNLSQDQARLLLSSVDALESLEKYTGQDVDVSDKMVLKLESIAAGVTDQSQWDALIDQIEVGQEEYISWLELNIAERRKEAERLYALEEEQNAAADQMASYFQAISTYLLKQTNIEALSQSIAGLQSQAASKQQMAMMAMMMGVPMAFMMYMQEYQQIMNQVNSLQNQLNYWMNLVVDLPEYATGGIVYERTLATVGEAGPEAIVPLSGGAIPVRINGMTGGSSEDVVAAIYQMNQDMAELTRKVVDNTAAIAGHTYRTNKAIERSNYAAELTEA